VYTLRLINIYKYDRKKRYKEKNRCVMHAVPFTVVVEQIEQRGTQ